jgi:hypothetical protein
MSSISHSDSMFELPVQALYYLPGIPISINKITTPANARASSPF